MLLPQEGHDAIVREETGGRAYYEKHALHPIVPPGDAAGVTIGSGYDLGQQSAETFAREWREFLPAEHVDRLAAACGLRGGTARAIVGEFADIVIPFDTAVAQFDRYSLPRYYAWTQRALPNFDELPPLCKSALVDLVYNCGAGRFTMAGDRSAEFRAIREHMAARAFARIPADLMSMRRLWPPSASGRPNPLAERRAREAAMFERGLAGQATPATRPAEAPGGDLSAADIRHAQDLLHAMKFHEVGACDGVIGSRTIAAVAAFKCERALAGEPVLDRGLLAALEQAHAEGWLRPIPHDRAQGKPDDSRIVASAERQATLTTTTGGTIATGGILAWLTQKYDAVQQALAPLAPYAKPFATLLLEYWWAFLGAGLAYLLIEQAHVRNARIEDHREGKTT